MCVRVYARVRSMYTGKQRRKRPGKASTLGVFSLRKECLKKKPMGGVSSLGAGSGGWAQVRELLRPRQSQPSPPGPALTGQLSLHPR